MLLQEEFQNWNVADLRTKVMRYPHCRPRPSGRMFGDRQRGELPMLYDDLGLTPSMNRFTFTYRKPKLPLET